MVHLTHGSSEMQFITRPCSKLNARCNTEHRGEGDDYPIQFGSTDKSFVVVFVHERYWPLPPCQRVRMWSTCDTYSYSRIPVLKVVGLALNPPISQFERSTSNISLDSIIWSYYLATCWYATFSDRLLIQHKVTHGPALHNYLSLSFQLSICAFES